MPLEEFNPNWAAIGVIGGFVINIAGWFISHHLARRREDRKERRAREEDAAREARAKAAAEYLNEREREILHYCLEGGPGAKGLVLILHADAAGKWIRAGRHDFIDMADGSVQAGYLDSFASLCAKGYFRREGSNGFALTGAGYERAQKGG